MTTEKFEQLLKVCRDVAADVEADASTFDGRPFTGRTVGEYFGNHGAAIAALANVLEQVLRDETPSDD